jgi:hypothetical protein
MGGSLLIFISLFNGVRNLLASKVCGASCCP